MSESERQWSIVAAGKADQSCGMLLQFVFAHRAFAFGRAQLHFGDQAAEILVAEAGRDKKRKAERIADCSIFDCRFLDFASLQLAIRQSGNRKFFARDFRSDVRFDSRFLCRHVETRRAIESVAIEQRHGRHLQVGAGRDQIFGQGSAFEKTESRAGVELDVHKVRFQFALRKMQARLLANLNLVCSVIVPSTIHLPLEQIADQAI